MGSTVGRQGLCTWAVSYCIEDLIVPAVVQVLHNIIDNSVLLFPKQETIPHVHAWEKQKSRFGVDIGTGVVYGLFWRNSIGL